MWYSIVLIIVLKVLYIVLYIVHIRVILTEGTARHDLMEKLQDILSHQRKGKVNTAPFSIFPLLTVIVFWYYYNVVIITQMFPSLKNVIKPSKSIFSS